MDADVYVLAKDRSSALCIEVLERFLPYRQYQGLNLEQGFVYWNEEDSADTQEMYFKTESDLLHFLEQAREVSFWPSFKATRELDFRRAQFYFLHDGGLIIGLNLYQNSKKEEETLSELRTLANSSYGYISYNCPPELSSKEFIAECNRIGS